MKKILALVLSLAMALACLAGCSGGTNPSTSPSTNPSTAPSQGTEPGTGYDGPSIELICSWTAPESSMAAYVATLNEVTEATDGKVTFVHYYSNALMQIPEVVQGVGTGVADIADISFHMYPSQFVYASQVTGTPFYGGESSEQLSKMYEYLLGEFPVITEEFTDNNLHFLGVGGFMQGYVLNVVSDADLRLPEDFRGMQIIESNDVLSAMFVSAGAAPVNQPVTEYYSALEKGVCDALCQVPTVAKAFGALALCKQIVYFGNDGLLCNPKCCMINLDKWNSFTPELQAIFNEAFEDFVYTACTTNLQDRVELYDMIDNLGIKQVYLTDAEMDVWRALAEPLTTEHLQGLVDNGYSEVNAIYEAGRTFLANYPGDEWMNAGRFATEAEWVQHLRDCGWSAEGFSGNKETDPWY